MRGGRHDEADASELRRRLVGLRLGMLANLPFYGTLAMHAEFEPSWSIPLAATDGRKIYLHPNRFVSLDHKEAEFVLAHEIMHCALRHVPRRGARDPFLWNVACDCIVNEILAEGGLFRIPQGGVRSKTLGEMLNGLPRRSLHTLDAEELYELLKQRATSVLRNSTYAVDDSDAQSWESSRTFDTASIRDLDPVFIGDRMTGDGSRADEPALALPMKAISSHDARTECSHDSRWRRALAAAATAQRIHENHQGGPTPRLLERVIQQTVEGSVDWRPLLWQHLTRFPADYTGLDRRFVQDEAYLWTLEGEQLRLHICIDTSGSINQEQLASFVTEIGSILDVHAHVTAQVFFCDTKLQGPYLIESLDQLPTPRGGGGTDFRPFFAAVEEGTLPSESSVAVYLTDGYGVFPTEPPDLPVIWVVPTGGVEETDLPFGNVARISVADEATAPFGRSA